MKIRAAGAEFFHSDGRNFANEVPKIGDDNKNTGTCLNCLTVSSYYSEEK